MWIRTLLTCTLVLALWAVLSPTSALADDPLYTDTVNSRIGIGTTTPQTKLDILDNSASPAVSILQKGSGPTLSLGEPGNTVFPAIRLNTKANLGQFNIQTGGSNFTYNGQTFFDDVLFWGFNAGDAGTKIKPGAARLAMSMESDYWWSGQANGKHAMEWNLDFTNPSGTINKRPLEFALDRDNLSYMYWIWKIGPHPGPSHFTVQNQNGANYFRVNSQGNTEIYNGLNLVNPSSGDIWATGPKPMKFGTNGRIRASISATEDRFNLGTNSDASIVRPSYGNLRVDAALEVNGNLSTTRNLYVPSLALPTTTPASYSNRAAIQFDTTANKLCVFTTAWLCTSKLTSQSSANSGTATIPAGQTQVSVSTTQVKDTSLIFLTPTSPTGGQTLVVGSQTAGQGFTVSLDHAYSTDIRFNWLLTEN